jgi:hypothetical protein
MDYIADVLANGIQCFTNGLQQFGHIGHHTEIPGALLTGQAKHELNKAVESARRAR